MGLQQGFSLKVNEMSFLSADDPPAYTLIKNDSPIIFTGPHNGVAVPKSLPPFLGMEQEWFLKAHESHDLFAAEFFETLKTKLPKANFIAGNYSRLVADLNAFPDASILSSSTEYPDLKIAGNINLSEQLMAARIQNIHWPYHDALADLIKDTREQQGRVLMLDIHSFSPIWEGCPLKRCDVEISTLRPSKTPYSNAFEEFLKQENAPFKFISGHPYRVAERPNNAAHLTQARNNIQYLGVEIRSDLINTEEKCIKMAEYISSALANVMAQPNLEEIMAPWNEPPKTKPPEQDLTQIWM